MSTGSVLNVTQLFTALTLLTITTTQFFILLQAIPGFASGITCLCRIQDFLVLPIISDDESENEVPNAGDDLDVCSEKDHALFTIKNGSFGYNEKKAVLHNINVAIQQGKINLLIGSYVIKFLLLLFFKQVIYVRWSTRKY